MKSIKDYLYKDTYPYAGGYDNMDDYVENFIKKGTKYFIQPIGLNKNEYAGWKYTIVGDNLEDALFLYNNVGKYLKKIDIPFKMGTKKLIECDDEEQSKKLMTIYIKKDTKFEYLLDDLKYYLKGYNPKAKLKWSEHVYGPIYKRKDTNENGEYIPANPNK